MVYFTMTIFAYYACLEGVHLDTREVENVMESANGDWIGFNSTNRKSKTNRASLYFTDKEDIALVSLCFGVNYLLPEAFSFPFEFHEPKNKFYDVVR